MKVAVISDIHSNIYALKAVIADLAKENISRFFVLGDMFGYYPWAVETYDLLMSLNCIFIKGNHDLLIETGEEMKSPPWYANLILHNRQELISKRPEAISWLSKLNFQLVVAVDDFKIDLYHGSPLDPVNGRIYPDFFEKMSASERRLLSWLPTEKEMVLFGHTHYPFCLMTEKNGLVGNPGSVGQPRDGIPMPSWALIDSVSGSFELKRTVYDYEAVVKILNMANWNARATKALAKNYTGELRY